uniref:Uncharacterized protein n=1 Tax=Anguilla anguilla TaxID=7936 RepID=A0A0E9RFN7_ANGAN
MKLYFNNNSICYNNDQKSQRWIGVVSVNEYFCILTCHHRHNPFIN